MYRKERVVQEEIKNIHGNLREKSSGWTHSGV